MSLILAIFQNIYVISIGKGQLGVGIKNNLSYEVVSSLPCLEAGLGSITFLSGTLLITFNVMHDNSMNVQVRCVISLNSLPFMTFWCKIMTKTKFEL
jgi:hypothetical protein